MSYDDTGVRCTMLRGGTSRGLYFEARDLPADPAARDDLLLRLMGTPGPAADRRARRRHDADQQGGRRVARPRTPDVDVDYLFLQLGVDEATVSDRQNCGNILAGVGPFAVERGLVPAGDGETSVRIRMVNSDSVAVATFPTPGRPGRVPRRRRDRRRPRHGGPGRPRLRRHRGVGDRRACCPPGTSATRSTGIEVTCVDNGMPVVAGAGRVVRAHRVRAARAAGRRRGAARPDRRLPPQGRPSSWAWATSPRASVPKTVLLAAARRRRPGVHPVVHPGAAAHLDRRARRGQRRHRDAAARRRRARAHRRTGRARRSQVDVEHPTGHLLVDVVVDGSVDARRGSSAPASSAPPASSSTAPPSPAPEPPSTTRRPPCPRCTTSPTSPTSSCSPTSRRRASTSSCATSA